MWFCDGAFSSSSPQRFQEVARVDGGTRTCVFFLSSDVCILRERKSLYLSTTSFLYTSPKSQHQTHHSHSLPLTPPSTFPPSLSHPKPKSQTDPTCLKTGLRGPPPHRLDLHPLLLRHRQPSPLLPIHKPNLRSPLRHVLFQPHARREKKGYCC
jgi:hypothetical protein